MRVEIEHIKDFGNLQKERVIFKVNAPTNIGQYMVAESVKVNDNAISSEIKNQYWLPDQDLKIGDLVVLYTKKGEKKSVLNKDGSTTYFFYWGLENPLASVKKSCVVLFETSWMFKEASPTADNDRIKQQAV